MHLSDYDLIEKQSNADITVGYSRETTLIVLRINKNLLVGIRPA